MAPVLIALNASLEIAENNKTNIIPLENIYTGDGLNPKDLSRNAIVKFIRISMSEQYNCVFKKLRPRAAVDFTSLTTVVSVNDNGNIRIVLGGVDPKPVVIEGTVADKKAELIALAVKKPRIVNNDYYSRIYRKEMISVFLEQSFMELETIFKK